MVSDRKKQLLILAVVNIITQIILNVLLNVINYNSGPLAFTFFYVLFELIVFALEAVLYCTILKRLSEKKKGGCILYPVFLCGQSDLIWCWIIPGGKTARHVLI